MSLPVYYIRRCLSARPTKKPLFSTWLRATAAPLGTTVSVLGGSPRRRIVQNKPASSPDALGRPPLSFVPTWFKKPAHLLQIRRHHFASQRFSHSPGRAGWSNLSFRIGKEALCVSAMIFTSMMQPRCFSNR